MEIDVNQMNLNTNLDLPRAYCIKLMSLVTSSNSFSYLSNTKIPMMATSAVSKNLCNVIRVWYLRDHSLRNTVPACNKEDQTKIDKSKFFFFVTQVYYDVFSLTNVCQYNEQTVGIPMTSLWCHKGEPLAM